MYCLQSVISIFTHELTETDGSQTTENLIYINLGDVIPLCLFKSSEIYPPNNTTSRIGLF
jgi:hypothetical protein